MLNETKFNFNSQVCTSKVQSERLLALGLKKETADMYWFNESPYNSIDDWKCYTYGSDGSEDEIPAWSLGRLVCLMPSVLGDYTLCANSKMVGYFSSVGRGYSFDWFLREGEIFGNIIDCIEWLIKEGYFNKEYLE